VYLHGTKCCTIQVQPGRLCSLIREAVSGMGVDWSPILAASRNKTEVWVDLVWSQKGGALLSLAAVEQSQNAAQNHATFRLATNTDGTAGPPSSMTGPIEPPPSGPAHKGQPRFRPEVRQHSIQYRDCPLYKATDFPPKACSSFLLSPNQVTRSCILCHQVKAALWRTHTNNTTQTTHAPIYTL
jgi:hypothetical protein